MRAFGFVATAAASAVVITGAISDHLLNLGRMEDVSLSRLWLWRLDMEL